MAISSRGAPRRAAGRPSRRRSSWAARRATRPSRAASSRPVRFSSPGTCAAAAMRWTRKVRRRPVVDRGRVHAESADAAFLHEELGRAPRRTTGSAGVTRRSACRRRSSGCGRATAPTSPFLRRTIAPARNRAVRGLPALHVGGREAVIRILRRLRRDVENDGGRDEPANGHFLGALPRLREVNGSVEVRAAVLRACRGNSTSRTNRPESCPSRASSARRPTAMSASRASSRRR